MPDLTVTVPEGEDIVRVQWKGVRFALIPRFKNDATGHDDAYHELRTLKDAPGSFSENEIVEHLSFTLEVPLTDVDRRATGVLHSTQQPFVDASIDHLREFVDDSINDDDRDAIFAAARAAYLQLRKKRVQ